MTVDIEDPELTLAELFHGHPAVATVFWRHGTACVGCPIAPFHTVRDTCAEYRLDEAAFRADVRAACGSIPPRRSAPRAGGAQSPSRAGARS